MAGYCNASQDAQDAWDTGDAWLASGRNANGSDAGSVFADDNRISTLLTKNSFHKLNCEYQLAA